MTEQTGRDIGTDAKVAVTTARSLREAARAAVERAMGIAGGRSERRGADRPGRDESRGRGAKEHGVRAEKNGARDEAERIVRDVALKGRYMREDLSEHACIAREMAVDHVIVETEEAPEAGERVVVYIDEVGRLEGDVVRSGEGRFVISPRLTAARREKLVQTIEWLRDRKAGRAAERRRHVRFEPADGKSAVVLSDNRRYPCEVLDISLSGASLRMPVLPAIGTYLTLGRMRGRVVRHHQAGIAVEFVRVADSEGLRRSVRRL